MALTEEQVPGDGQAGGARQITLNGGLICHSGTSFSAIRRLRVTWKPSYASDQGRVKLINATLQGFFQSSVSPSLMGRITTSTRSSVATIELNWRILSVFSERSVSSATRPDQSVLSTAISPPG